MNLPLKIALRYIFSKHSFNFITVITAISLVGITVGVAALIVVMSIFNGFRELTESQIVGFDPHLRITPAEGGWLDNPQEITNKLDSIREIESYSSALSGRVVAMKGSNLQVFTLNAISEPHSDYYDGMRSSTGYGHFEFEGHTLPGLVIGAGLADRIRVLPGDTVRMMSPGMIESSIRTFRLRRGIEFLVTGIFMTNIKDYDIRYGFAGFDSGKRLFSPPDASISQIDIRTNDLDNIESIKRRVASLMPEGVRVESWRDLNRELYEVMQFERMASFAVLSLIIIIAVFNVLASLTMTVVEKHADIGVLKSLGATDRMINRIYIYEGALIGVISSVVGGMLGVGLCLGQINFKWFRVDTSKYIIDAIPVSLYAGDVALVMIFSLSLAILATIYPARRAASTRAIEAIREG
ncbi:MAG: FtsX-like permease family protein [Candidatus Kapaibacterium sp.]